MPTFGPYPAWIVDVHDGDTMTVDLDLGFDLTLRSRCRIAGINAPELSTDAGKQAAVYARTVVMVGDKVTIRSLGWDKYGGRFDGTVTLADGRDFGTLMLDTNHAVPYKV